MLPYELLLTIAKYLDPQSLLLFIVTCKKHRQIYNDSIFWTKLLLSKYPKLSFIDKNKARETYFKLAFTHKIIKIYIADNKQCLILPLGITQNAFIKVVNAKIGTNYNIRIFDDKYKYLDKWSDKINRIFIIQSSIDYVNIMKRFLKRKLKLEPFLRNIISNIIMNLGADLHMIERELEWQKYRHFNYTDILDKVIYCSYSQLLLSYYFDKLNDRYDKDDWDEEIEILREYLDEWNELGLGTHFIYNKLQILPPT